jgi:hypothetical protein
MHNFEYVTNVHKLGNFRDHRSVLLFYIKVVASQQENHR